jgi:hypothetical protein
MAKQNAIAAKAAASMLTGIEPTGSKLDPSNESYNGQILTVFNWYSAEKTRTDAHKYLLEYVKKNRNKDYKTFQRVNENKVITTIGWLARLLTRGAKISEEHQLRLEQHIDILINTTLVKDVIDDVVEKEKKAVINIQEAIKQKTKEYIGELEGAIDDFIKLDKEFSLYNDFKSKQIPAPYVQDVKEWAEKKLAEYAEVIAGEDSQLIEGYSNFNKKKLKALVKLFEQFIEDCNMYGQFKKANRKPRATREKSPAQQVKSMKYKTKDEELGIDSERPIDVVGAQQVWVFNTKTRKLAVYTSESTKGMTVKGTTLQNWMPEKSKQKTLRKPQEQIKSLMSSGKVKLRTFMDDIKSKEQDVNGRINIDTVILKILR